MRTGQAFFKQVPWPYSVTVVLLSFTLICSKVTAIRTPEQLAQPLDTIPLTIGDWTGTSNVELAPSIVAALHPTAYISRGYGDGRNGHGMELFIAYYAQQRAGESIHTPKHCLPGGGWEVVDSGVVDVPLAHNAVKVNKYRVQQAGERLLILYWYQSKKRIVASEYIGKLYMARDAIVDGYTGGSIVRITLEDSPEALHRAILFASKLIPYVQECFAAHPAASIPAHTKFVNPTRQS